MGPMGPWAHGTGTRGRCGMLRGGGGEQQPRAHRPGPWARAHGPMGPMGYGIPHPHPYPYPGPSPLSLSHPLFPSPPFPDLLEEGTFALSSSGDQIIVFVGTISSPIYVGVRGHPYGIFYSCPR